MTFVFLKNELIPSDNAHISYRDRGFRFGDGVFETLLVRSSIPYQYEWHLERLTKGLAAIKIRFDTAILHEHCRKLLAKNQVKEGLLRIQITRGEGGKGYLPDPASSPTLLIETLPLPEIPKEPISLWLTSYEKISQRALPIQYKLTQGLNSTLARIEAAEHHCYDALMLNHKNQITETTSGNIFWLKDDILYTPALSCGLLEGSTRAAILRLSPYATREVSAGLDALVGTQAVFITNAVIGVLSVKELMPQSYQWKSQPQVQRFYDLLQDDIAKYASQTSWS